jgi:hypothetical protein
MLPINPNINIDSLKLREKSKKRPEINNIKKNLKPFISKICKYDFFSINEALICEKIKKIRYYYNRFLILEKHNFIKIEEIDEMDINNSNTDYNFNNPINNPNKYLLFQYKNQNVAEFNDFLSTLNTPKQLVFHILESFSYLLESISHLNDINICFFELCPDNIVFNLENGFVPLIYNFKNSIYISKLNEEFICKLIPNITDFTYKPLEVHILFYLIKNNLKTLTNDLILIISEKYIDNLSILSLFSESYKEQFKIACIDILTKYIDKPKTDIICDILENNETWDSYALSIIYLHIIGTIIQVFELKGTFFSKLLIELMKNIHPNPLKRTNLKTIKTNYNALLEEFDDWSFINKIPQQKIELLLDNISPLR